MARFELPDNTALRPFIGFDGDTTKLFLCTVNGRQELSLGMSVQEMANVLLSIGA
jgi:exopolysaccharide biosynthesis protein